MKSLSAFEPVDGLKDVHTAARENLRCTAIRLRSGGLCLFSPVKGLGDIALASLRELGQVEALLAPNHWHNMGLHEYARAFPNATLYATPAAGARLGIITQLTFADTAKLKALLPRGMRFVIPAGLKTGEVWLSITQSRRCAWIVVDAFCGSKMTKRGAFGDPHILKTFPKFGLGDRGIYLPWLERQLESDRPTMIVPCHGEISAGSQLVEKVQRLVAARL